MPAAEVGGVPESVAVPLELALNVTPLGSVPVSLSVGVGDPLAAMVKLKAEPAVTESLLALVNVGATCRAKVIEPADPAAPTPVAEPRVLATLLTV